ncbi:MAG: 4-(cytidine 5'-diphospho)-2-C-methyl-D-erythritol kinase [Bacteroidota bacterium]
MIYFPNAKINIGLNITEKRNDGFHTIETIFYPVKWCDIAEFIVNNESTPSFKHSGIPLDISANEDNLCYKAYLLLKEDYRLPPLQFHLHKVIPVGAGLGGGSSDAAYTLYYLNDYFNLRLSLGRLANYAEKLGSDCPFFINNKPTFATEKGNRLRNIELDLQDHYIVIVYPDLYISTKEAYSGIVPQKNNESLETLIQSPVCEWRYAIKNDFETAIFKKYPEIEGIKKRLYNHGALYASMTGSGSSVYGIFDSPKNLASIFSENYQIWQGPL